jgi:hypothetical protein
MKILLSFLQTKQNTVHPELVEGWMTNRSCFDGLSTNGLIVEEYVFSIMDS